MAATAQAMRKLDAASEDIMDLHSDSGLDFDDGDIDLDIDPAPLPQGEDDDISLTDAGADAALHSQTVTADQDDYMIDHDDYDDGDIQLEDDTHVDHAPTSHTPITQEQAPVPAPPDEDLIDYSDDDQPWPLYTFQPESPIYLGNFVEDDPTTLTLENDQGQAEAQVPGAANGDHQGEGANDGESLVQNQEDHDENEHGVHNETEYDTDGDTGGVPLQDQEPQTNRSEHEQDGQEEQPSIESRPITVSYEGNELWLFKQHDAEDSGDWFIDDTSLLHSSLSNLLQACRSSLGEDISNETELGLRFDHFHSMELFEDNTACVAVSLGRLLDLYYTLHAQDGESEPESFYISLLSRPRFATLLSDVAKHADDGNGYSGLNSAIAAGETHFVDAYSGHSTEHEGTDWDQEAEAQDEYDQENNGQEDNGQDDDDQEENGQDEHGQEEDDQEGSNATNEAAAGVDLVEHEEENTNEPEVGPEEHISSRDEGKHESATSPTVLPHLNRSLRHSSSPNVQESSARSEENVQQDAIAKQAAEQLLNDTVDYSDDDDEEPQAQALTNASPSSATVQGDNSTTLETSLAAAEPTEFEGQHQTGHDDAFPGADDETYDDYAQNEEQFDHNNDAGSYQDYAQTLGHDETSEQLQLDPADAHPPEADFDGQTNHDYTGYDYQDLDQQLQNDFLSGDLDGTGTGESADAANEFTGGDDFLDLDNAAEWGTDQGQSFETTGENILTHDEVTAQNEEEEDGVVEQPVVAASSTADPVAASSTDLQETSLQGQKRSRDEAGDSVGDALDLSDTKRPKV